MIGFSTKLFLLNIALWWNLGPEFCELMLLSCYKNLVGPGLWVT